MSAPSAPRSPDLSSRLAALARLRRSDPLPIPRVSTTPTAAAQAPRDVRIIAPPASGKTGRLVAHAVKRLNDGVDPNGIILLARRDGSAATLRTQLASVAAPPRVDTIDRYAYYLLRTHVPHEYRPVAPNATRHRICKDALAALSASSASHAEALPPELDALATFALLKEHAIDPRDPSAQAIANQLVELGIHGELAMQAIYFFYRAYDLALRNELCIDREDRKLRLLAALIADPGLSSRIGIQELLVDDAHNLSRLDVLLIKELTADGWVVAAGNDDQPVDPGCSAHHFLELAEQLGRPVQTELLHDVPDCPGDVVALADRLIGYNHDRIDKRLRTSSTARGVKVLSAPSPAEESRLLAEALATAEMPALVLHRPGAACYPLQLRLLRSGMSYDARPDEDLVASGALDRALALLRVRSALRAGLAPADGDATQALRALFPGASLDALATAIAAQGLLIAIDQPEAAAALPDVGRALGTVIAAATPGQGLVAAAAWAAVHYGPEAAAPLAAVAALAAELGEEARALADTLIELRAAADSRSIRAFALPAVDLLPYEEVRGGKWRTVVLTGCNEGHLPDPGRDVQQERRAVHDAMLRAASTLIVSYVDDHPSRFLYETGIL